MNAKVFILDVDGVMTTGQFLYSKDGKVMKVFGPDDNDALNMLKPHIEIRFITADKNGLPISHKRIKEDMNFQLDLVGTIERAKKAIDQVNILIDDIHTPSNSIFWTNHLKANTSSDFINKITTEASTILSSSENDKLKISKLIKIGKESVDIDGLALYTLGKHRKSLDDNQKSEFVKIFNDYFLKSFSSRLVEYKDAKIVVISEEVKNEKYTIVKSKLLATSKRPEVKIDWRVYTIDPEKPLIRDLIIEGLSLARTQREEFNSIIVNNSGDVNALFSNLREFINK